MNDYISELSSFFKTIYSYFKVDFIFDIPQIELDIGEFYKFNNLI